MDVFYHERDPFVKMMQKWKSFLKDVIIDSKIGIIMKKRILWFFYLVCLLIPFFLAGQSNSNPEKDLETLRKLRLTQPILNKASDLLAAKDWEGAARQFNRCLEALPESPDACFGMAYICNQTGEIAKALAWIEQAEQASLYLQQVWENQKTILFKSSQEEQIRLLKLAEDLQNNGMSAYSCKSNKLSAESSQATQKAREITAKGNTESSPFEIPAEFYSLHGNLLFKLKRWEEAEAQYLKALAIAPDHQRCLNNLINVYFVTGKIEQARSWLEKAIQQKVKINPGLVQAVRSAKPAEKSQNTP
jgi:Flp pilus assembly protein TadD